MSHSPEMPDDAKIAEMRMQVEKISSDPADQIRILKLTIGQIEKTKLLKQSPERSREKLDTETEAMGHMFEIIKTVRGLIGEYKLGGRPIEVVKQGLEKRGLGFLFDETYKNTLQLLEKLGEEQAFNTDIDWTQQNPTQAVRDAFDRVCAQNEMEKDMEIVKQRLAKGEDYVNREKAKGRSDLFEVLPYENYITKQRENKILKCTESDVYNYVLRIEVLQAIIEALPIEAGLTQLDPRDIANASTVFHKELGAMIAEYGYSYVPVHLYQDSLDNNVEIRKYIEQTHGAFEWPYDVEKRPLVGQTLGIKHGLITRLHGLLAKTPSGKFISFATVNFFSEKTR